MHSGRRARALAGAVGAVLVVLAVALPALATADPATVLFRLGDPRLTEISGLAPGIRSPGTFFAANDSGDSARFFALDGRTGDVRAEYRVAGARNVDWEDVAVAPDRRGVPSVWLADIGDNDATRSEVDVYRVDEPRVGGGTSAPVILSSPEVWRVRYPDGAHNAESLAVTPSGAAYIITKSLTGASGVYELPAAPDADQVKPLRKIGSIRFGIVRVASPRDTAGQLTATGAAVSRDGTLLAVRTYSDAYLWRLGAGGVAAALRSQPTRVELPSQPQGESVAFDGARLVVASEHVGSDVDAVPLPAGVGAPASPSSTASSGASSAAVSTAVSSSTASPPGGGGGGSATAATAVLVGVIFLGGAAAVFGVIRPALRRR